MSSPGNREVPRERLAIVGMDLHNQIFEAASSDTFVDELCGTRSSVTQYTMMASDTTLILTKSGPTFNAAANYAILPATRVRSSGPRSQDVFLYPDHLSGLRSNTAKIGTSQVSVDELLLQATLSDTATFETFLDEVIPKAEVQFDHTQSIFFSGVDPDYGTFRLNAIRNTQRKASQRKASRIINLSRSFYPESFNFGADFIDTAEAGEPAAPRLISVRYEYKSKGLDKSVVTVDRLRTVEEVGLHAVQYMGGYIAGQRPDAQRHVPANQTSDAAQRGYEKGFANRLH